MKSITPTLTLQRKHLWILGLFSLGIILRYILMSWGHHGDFEAYCIAGEIAGNFRIVYAETRLYNYGPMFFCIQGLLYKISQIRPEYWVGIFKVLIVTVLTLADLGIAAFIANRYSWKKALIFFLNPISIIITGHQNQFDNIAVLFALLSIIFFNEDKKFNKKDIGFVALFSLSLITKHILFILPVFILFMDKLPLKKKILYAFVPPLIFLLSFVPFALSSSEALHGIINNVFRYRSFNNSPLLIILYKLINFPKELRIIVYAIMMTLLAFYVRKLKFENIMLIYLIAMVSFSSAIVNQYMVIPIAALCILDVGIWNKIYIAALFVYLSFEGGGLGLFNGLKTILPESILGIPYFAYFPMLGAMTAAWILFFALVRVLKQQKFYELKF